MNHHPASLFHIAYRMQRGDYMALAAMLTRRDRGRVALELGVYLALLLGLTAVAAGGSPERMIDVAAGIFRLPEAFIYVPLVLAGPVLLLSAPLLTGLVAALVYQRNAIADRDITLELTAEGIEGGSADLYSRIGWAAVNRLVETDSHLFVQISPREALIIPRRAVPNEDTYRNIVGFIRARTGLATS